MLLLRCFKFGEQKSDSEAHRHHHTTAANIILFGYFFQLERNKITSFTLVRQKRDLGWMLNLIMGKRSSHIIFLPEQSKRNDLII